MNIVYVSNEKYVPHLAASICSVCDNNRKETVLDFYVISTGITEDSLRKLAALCSSYGRNLTVSDLHDIKNRIQEKDSAFISKFDISILGRFFLSELLPEDIDKVLYLDCDTIVTSSLSGLYNSLPEDGKIIAAVMEPTIYKKTKQMLGMNPDDPYFNSGVLLIDLKLWRSADVDEKLREYFDSISRESIFADQDAINGLLKGQIKSVSPKYNFFTNYRYFDRNTLVNTDSSYSEITEEEFESSRRNPAVIHYCGDERPWIHGNHNPFKKEYYKYLDMTEWKDTPEETGKEKYMFLYHIMNVSTKAFPAVRKTISDTYSKKLYKNENRSNNSKS